MADQRSGGNRSGFVLAVDLGGTRLRVGICDQDGRLIDRRSMETPPGGPDDVVRAIERLATSLDGPQATAAGVAAPGPLDPATGVVIATPNLAGFEGYPLRERLSSALGMPVHVHNDASLAAMGEFVHGAGRNSRLMVYLTISTGIGGGVVEGGRLHEGAHGLASEFGHMVVAAGGPACAFGHAGCLEALASGSAIAAAAAARQVGSAAWAAHAASPVERPTARSVAEAAAAGDAEARAILERAAHFLGIGIGNLVNAYDPDVVVLGGGVTGAWAWLWQPLQAAARSVVMAREVAVESGGPGIASAPGRVVRVVRAATGDDAGLLGAAWLARERERGD